MDVTRVGTKPTAPTHKPLVKAADGDYTAASIAANPGSAVGKVRQPDGDYRAACGVQAFASSPVLAALTALSEH